MRLDPPTFFLSTWQRAIPVLRVTGAGGRQWKRDMADPTDRRVGPWLQANYQVLDHSTWTRVGDCLYFVVAGSDGNLRYVGKSKKQVSERWRMSPALCAETGDLLPSKQLFHSQCMRPMQAEFALSPDAVFEVRTLSAQELRPLVAAAGLSEICEHPMDSRFVEELERWMCRAWSQEFVAWNKSGTGRKNRSTQRPSVL